MSCWRSPARRIRQAPVALAAMGFMTAVVAMAAATDGSGREPAQAPEARAVAFLAREVPRWKSENDCYSCHNNGDAARALIVAASRGFAVGDAMDDTLDWLRRPLTWNKNKTTGGIDDKPLARIQFAGALRLAVENGRAPGDALGEAARVVAADQKSDGSWQLDSSQSLGSPATYGTTLATAVARRTLAASARENVSGAVTKADRWLRAAKVDTVVDAAAVLLALERSDDAPAKAQRERALRTLQSGQGPDGGWGPYVSVGPQIFDTALALLALNELRSNPSLAAPVFTPQQFDQAIARGRTFLQSGQNEDGSWPETTRPANQESYAQRISTTGWALLALLATAQP
jgi:hypothetical protein